MLSPRNNVGVKIREAFTERDDQIGGQPGVAVAGRLCFDAEELAGNPRIAAVEQVQITDAESLQMRQPTTPDSTRERLQREPGERCRFRQSGPHHRDRVERRIAQRDHDPVETHAVQELRRDMHARSGRLGAIDRVERLRQRERRQTGRGRQGW